MKRLSFLFLFFFLLFGMTGVAWAQAEAEVAKLQEQFVKAINEGNLDALAALFAENAIGYSPFGPLRYEGRERARANFKGVIERTPKRQFVLRDMSIRVMGNTAVVNTYQDVTVTDREGKERKSTDRITTVWAKIGEKWQIVTHHGSRPVPRPGG